VGAGGGGGWWGVKGEGEVGERGGGGLGALVEVPPWFDRSRSRLPATADRPRSRPPPQSPTSAAKPSSPLTVRSWRRAQSSPALSPPSGAPSRRGPWGWGRGAGDGVWGAWWWWFSARATRTGPAPASPRRRPPPRPRCGTPTPPWLPPVAPACAGKRQPPTKAQGKWAVRAAQAAAPRLGRAPRLSPAPAPRRSCPPALPRP
jgi:hypothetical protein